MRIHMAARSQLTLSAKARARLAPVPSHEPRRSRPLEAAIVARVNGVPIHVDDLEAAMHTVIPLTSYHQNVKPEKMEELRKRALDGLIDEELRYQEAVRLKIQVLPPESGRASNAARKPNRAQNGFD